MDWAEEVANEFNGEIIKEGGMPNLNDLDTFLKPEDVTAGDILKFVDGGRFEDVDYSQAKDGKELTTVFQITVLLPSGKEKILTMNKRSQKNIKPEYGVESDEWVDKFIKVEKIKQNCFGQVRDVLYFYPTTETQEAE